MAIYLTAKEYDLPFMACLNGGLHTFDGKVTFSAIMIDALILKAGHKTEVLKLDDHECTIRFIRGDRRNDKEYKPFVFTYTTAQAQKAGYLSKKNWQTSLKDMLYSRCITGGGRKHMPEVFVGVLVAGELVGDDSDSNIAPLLPPNVAESTNLLPDSSSLGEKSAPILQISCEKSPKWDEFCLKYGIKEGTLAEAYLQKITKADLKNRTFTQIVNSAIENEDKFAQAFNAWQKNPEGKKKAKEIHGGETPRSMDEIAQEMEDELEQIAQDKSL